MLWMMIRKTRYLCRVRVAAAGVETAQAGEEEAGGDTAGRLICTLTKGFSALVGHSPSSLQTAQETDRRRLEKLKILQEQHQVLPVDLISCF